VLREDAGVDRDAEEPVAIVLPTPEATRRLGERIARLCRAGDLILLTGELGAGKTVLTQGIGRGLQVAGQVTSPTFVIARVHPSLVDGPALVHVDAYRLGSSDELDALDLDATLEDSVTVVEWGEGIAETLSTGRLEIHLDRRRGGASRSSGGAGTSSRYQDPQAGAEDPPADEERVARIHAVGSRWLGPAESQV
jgi:tRNA threonylcarbamoyladenosine biosynthesis protein TsaE